MILQYGIVVHLKPSSHQHVGVICRVTSVTRVDVICSVTSGTRAGMIRRVTSGTRVGVIYLVTSGTRVGMICRVTSGTRVGMICRVTSGTHAWAGGRNRYGHNWNIVFPLFPKKIDSSRQLANEIRWKVFLPCVIDSHLMILIVPY